MAFERDFIERTGEAGRSALLTYHKGLKQANLDMVPIVTGLLVNSKPGDQRFGIHFNTLAQREEHFAMCLIAPPDRADHEVVMVPPNVAAMIYGAYAGYNAYRCDNIRHAADPKVVEHLDNLTHHLEGLAQAASTATGKVGVPVGMLNLAYDSVLSEVDPLRYDREVVHPVGSAH